VTLEKWKVKVASACPKGTVRFTEENGTGTIVAHTGPDMQADVVGTYSTNEGTWTLYYHGYEEGSTEDVLNSSR
jgi:hypothetical protein